MSFTEQSKSMPFVEVLSIYFHIFVLFVLFSFLFCDHILYVIHLFISFRVALLALRRLYDHSNARFYDIFQM